MIHMNFHLFTYSIFISLLPKLINLSLPPIMWDFYASLRHFLKRESNGIIRFLKDGTYYDSVAWLHLHKTGRMAKLGPTTSVLTPRELSNVSHSFYTLQTPAKHLNEHYAVN